MPINQPRLAENWKDVFRSVWRLLRHSGHESVTPWQKWRAVLVLLWERAAPHLWPLFLVCAVFWISALFDWLQMLPGWLHSLLLVFLSLYAIQALVKLWQGTLWPTTHDILRRIEISSALENRPLTSLQDQLAAPRPDAHDYAWWQAHHQRLRAGLTKLRVGFPRSGFAPYDPFALRSVLLLALVLGIAQSGRDISARLERAFHPSVPPASQLLTDLNVWIKPPAYTGLPQQSLKVDTRDKVMIPENSSLFVQFSGAKVTPSFLIDGQEQELNAIADRTFQTSLTITRAEKLQANLGWQTLGKWPVEVIVDQPPTIDWDGEIYATPRAALRIGYKATDDYGLTAAEAIIKKPGEAGEIVLKLPTYAKPKQEIRNSSYHDVAYHLWAGSEVVMQLSGTDAAGHRVLSPPMKAKLPERKFEHPVARQVAVARRQFMLHEMDRPDLAETLENILSNPKGFGYDAKVTLALRVAQRRAQYTMDASMDGAIAELLWDVALRLEDSGISLAEKDLRALEQALQDAMSRGASADEIENLLNQYERAMDSYLNAMFQQMMEQGMDDLPTMDAQANALESSDIDRLLMQVRQLMRSGNNEEAQKLLAKLQEIMANIRTNKGQQNKPNKLAQELMKRAQGLIRDQQQALDQATGAIGAEAEKLTKQNADAIRKSMNQVSGDLAKLRKQLTDLGAPPIEPYANADASLKQLGKALGLPVKTPAEAQQQKERILAHEAETLNYLRAGLQELLKNMSQSGGGGQARAGRGRYDPFGRTRPGQGALDDPSVKVPAVQELQRAKEILDELQRRSGDYSRPELERDYIKRLLRRF